MYYVWWVFEVIVKYIYLGVLLAMAILFTMMILLWKRDRVMDMLKFPVLVDKFEALCDFSDDRDVSYKGNKLFGVDSWIGDLILKGAFCAFGLMIVWFILVALKG
jgi:hypothetical protein